MIQPNKILCPECGWRGLRHDLLAGEHPFDPARICAGCPKCHYLGNFTTICDEGDCTSEGSCGWPSAEGYRWSCGRHMREGDKSFSPPYKTIDIPMTEEMRREAEQHCDENVRKFMRGDL